MSERKLIICSCKNVRCFECGYQRFSCLYLINSIFLQTFEKRTILLRFFTRLNNPFHVCLVSFCFHFHSPLSHWSKPWTYPHNSFLSFLFSHQKWFLRWVSPMFIKRWCFSIFPYRLRSKQINCFWVFFVRHLFSLHDEFIFILYMIYVWFVSSYQLSQSIISLANGRFTTLMLLESWIFYRFITLWTMKASS